MKDNETLDSNWFFLFSFHIRNEYKYKYIPGLDACPVHALLTALINVMTPSAHACTHKLTHARDQIGRGIAQIQVQ